METMLNITPQTRVAELLQAYPELEEVLVAQAPAFEKLSNPVLRRSVARIVTLETAAGIGGVKVRELVATLRQAAGQSVEDLAEFSEPAHAVEQEAPAWFSDTAVCAAVDADALLESGEIPLQPVLEQARSLTEGGILRVSVAFEPIPLIETLHRQGFSTFVRQVESGSFELFVAAAGR